MKIFLSTPCYGGLCLEKYATSVIKLQIECLQNNIQLFVDTTENESLVHRARNVSVARFLKNSDADFFMFIDADIEFSSDSILNLIKKNMDVGVAVYPKKYVNWDAVKTGLENKEEKQCEFLASNLVFNTKGNKSVVDQDGFIEILDGPTGFMMIKREVIQKMYDHYKDTLFCVNDHQNRDFDDYVAIFDCMIDPESKRYLSEDYAFCRRWQQMGGKIHAHIYSTLGHVGNLPFSGCLEDRINKS